MIELVTQPEIERLRKKFIAAQALVDAERFWLAVQKRRKPSPSVDDNFVGPIG